jgi:hypothetical protein
MQASCGQDWFLEQLLWAISGLPGKTSSLIRTFFVEKEDRVALRYDYLRAANHETMSQYMGHMHLVDKLIPRHIKLSIPSSNTCSISFDVHSNLLT